MKGRQGRKGVTLVEVLISMTVLLIVFMGLVQSSLLSIDVNLRNELRDEAVSVGAEYATRIRSAGYSSIVITGAWTTSPIFTPWVSVARQFRNLNVNYAIERCGRTLDADNSQVGVRVRWQYRWGTYSHIVYYTMRRPAS